MVIFLHLQKSSSDRVALTGITGQKLMSEKHAGCGGFQETMN